MIMDNIFAERVAQIREMMREHGWDAVLVSGSDPHGSEYPAPRWKQVEWVSGFTGEAGDLVITLDHAGLWTDTRYFIQADRQLRGTGIELHKMRVPEQVPIPEWLADSADLGGEDAVYIAFDGLCWSNDSINAVRKAFGAEQGRNLVLVDIPDMLSPLWDDRPEIPKSPVMTLGEDMVGESREHKLQWFRRFLLEKGCDAALITDLDEIAWLLNIRGSDIEYNPLVISSLLVTFDSAVWFVRKDEFKTDGESGDSFYELEADGVSIRGYDELDLFLSGLSGNELPEKLFIDPGTLNYHVYNQLCQGVFSIEEGRSPVPARKAVKNEVEISGMREAHLEDGLAMEKFLFWLEETVGASEGEDSGGVYQGDGGASWACRQINEADAAAKLDALRSEIPGYRGNSFQTISAYGANAALPHYVTPDTGSAVLQPRGLFLVDSGGQYVFGTTDITRTVPLGPCTDLEKEDYTLVLKGHIALSRAVFPRGTAGCQIDALARNPLWLSKRNFGHGTGHGVGFFLGVHEGPQDIRQNFNSQPLLPGMITSDEPGIYREGLHGVRHENLVLCTEAGRNEFGEWLCFEPLTLCHFDTRPLVLSLLDRADIEWLNAYNERVFRTISPHLDSRTAAWLRSRTLPV